MSMSSKTTLVHHGWPLKLAIWMPSAPVMLAISKCRIVTLSQPVMYNTAPPPASWINAPVSVKFLTAAPPLDPTVNPDEVRKPCPLAPSVPSSTTPLAPTHVVPPTLTVPPGSTLTVTAGDLVTLDTLALEYVPEDTSTVSPPDDAETADWMVEHLAL